VRFAHLDSRWPKSLYGALFICAVLSCEAQAQSCAGMFASIRRSAMYCGFFCDQESLRPLQVSYEAQCIKLVVAPSPFDLDMVPQEEGSVGRGNRARD
jgi:hypothetical protein